ncbi:MAG: peroxiredoxin [Prolixibacteraceae bacterium]|jgi:peroxiredoxin Q/BCP
MSKIIAAAFLFFLTLNTQTAMSENELKPGDKIPHFVMNDESHNPVDISSFTGKYMVLYFYPKDDTPGCTKEACSFRDSYDVLVDAGAVVFGVSSDNPDSHFRFKQKYHLPFSLLSDTDGELRKLFGVPTNMFGLIPGRVTYIFNPEGKLIDVFDSQFSPEKHVAEALKIIKGK